MATTNKIQESLLKIREEARKRVAQNLAEISNPGISAESVVALRENLQGAVSKAISVRAGQLFVGDFAEQILNFAQQKERLLRYSFDDDDAILAPPNCRLFLQNEEGGMVVIEEPPQYRTIFIGDNDDFDEDFDGFIPIRVPLPYLIFVINFSKRTATTRHGNEIRFYPGSCGLGFRNTPLKSVDDILFSPCLPHCDVNGSCLPAPADGNNVPELIENYLNSFWRSGFVDGFRYFDLKHKGSPRKVRNIRNYTEWSKVEPLDMLSYQSSISYNLKNLIERFNYNFHSRKSQKISQTVKEICVELTASLKSEALSDLIHTTSEKILETSLKTTFPDSALQPK